MATAVEDLYQVFASYPRNARIGLCDHCLGENPELRLPALPLRRLDTADLSSYAFKAMTTWGDVKDFKHFLPRLFELLAISPKAGSELCPEVLISKLGYGGWHGWPEIEQDTVRRYLKGLWVHSLSVFPSHIDIDDLVRGIAQITEDIGPFLDQWIARDSASPLRHLADFTCLYTPTLNKQGGLQDSSLPEHQQIIILKWLMSDKVVNALETGFFKFSEETFAADLSDALQQILRIRIKKSPHTSDIE